MSSILYDYLAVIFKTIFMKKKLYLILSTTAIISSSQAQIILAGDINAGTVESRPGMFTPFNDKLYMVARTSATGFELFNYDQISAPNLIYDLFTGSNDGVATPSTRYKLAILDNEMYFSGSADGLGFELFKVGTGSVPVRAGNEIYVGPTSSNPAYITPLKGKLYFSATNATNGTELFVYDPLTNKSTLVDDIQPGSASSEPQWITVYKDKLYFSALNSSFGTELYSYDPVTDATTLVEDTYVGVFSSIPYYLTVIDDMLYYVAGSATFGRELYRYDGTTVTRCTDLNPGSGEGVNSRPFLYKNKIYIAGNDGTSNFQLFTYDPATSAIALAYTFDPSISGLPHTFTAYGGKLYFSARTSTNGYELWESDGTTTKMVQDLEPGAAGSNPSSLTVWKGKLYFSATTASYGNEFYELSTPEGLGLANVPFKGSVILAPNPSTSDTRLLLNLDVSQKLQISVHDIKGSQLYHTPVCQYQSGSQEVTLPVNQYITGTYFYTIADEQGRILMNGKISKL